MAPASSKKFLDIQANYRVWIHSETRTWYNNNIQSRFLGEKPDGDFVFKTSSPNTVIPLPKKQQHHIQKNNYTLQITSLSTHTNCVSSKTVDDWLDIDTLTTRNNTLPWTLLQFPTHWLQVASAEFPSKI